MREWRHSSTILDLGTRWRWVVSFTPRPVYSRGNSPRYPLDRRLGRPQSWFGHCGVETNVLSLPGIEPRPCNPYPSLYRLSYSGSIQHSRRNLIEIRSALSEMKLIYRNTISPFFITVMRFVRIRI
jgi:hypothetical protein